MLLLNCILVYKIFPSASLILSKSIKAKDTLKKVLQHEIHIVDLLTAPYNLQAQAHVSQD